MKTLIDKMKGQMERNVEFKYALELEVYQDACVRNMDMKRLNCEDMMSPASFFLLLYHAKKDQNFSESSQIGDRLLCNSFIQHKKLLPFFLGQLEELSEYELSTLLELSQILKTNRLAQFKERKKIKKKKEILRHHLQFFEVLKHENISLSDFIFFLEIYKGFTKSERKIFTYFKHYLALYDLHLRGQVISKKMANSEVSASFLSAYNIFYEHTKKLERKQKLFLKEQRNLKTLYQQRITSLEAMTKNDYLEITEKELQTFPIDLLKEMEIAFLSHNKIIFDELEKKIDSFKGRNDLVLQNLFQACGLSFTNEEFQGILDVNLELEELERRIKICNNLKLDFQELAFFFCTIEDDIFKFLISFLEADAISFSFLKNHLEELGNKDVLEKIQDNYVFFKQLGVDKKYFDELLLLEPNKIQEQIKIADFYQLKSYEGIFKPNFFDTLDIWIEQGIYAFFEKNSEIRAFDFVNITKRILIGKKLGLSIFDEHGKLLPMFLEEKKFFLPNATLDAYIGNAVPFYLQNNVPREEISIDVSQLDAFYFQDSLTYLISGIKISRPKVLRMCEEGFGDPMTLLYGSIVDSFECEVLLAEISKKRLFSKNLRKM